jgi:hypothetical protein
MTAIRPILARRLLGLTAAPVLLVGLAACGDDDSAGGRFCDGATDVDRAFADVDMMSPDAEGIDDVAAAMQELDPPSEIADDWNTLASAFETVASFDPSDPAAAEEATDLEDARAAFTNVADYLEDECGIDGAAL